MMHAQTPTTIRASAGQGFVETPFVQDLLQRGQTYLKAGFPVHLLGPTGCGKTTLALHMSELLGRPAMLMYGDDEFGTSDLIGIEAGYQRRKTVDNYIHSVLKVEESVNYNWSDNRLTIAVSQGYTLIYDEFTRSKPEANNALLSVLAEGILVLPAHHGRRSYIKAHPDFRVIFTSNPIEYIGTHKTQDALMDRIITIHVPGMDRETEIAIAAARSGLSLSDAETVIDVIHRVRDAGLVNTPPSVRASVMISRVLATTSIPAAPDNAMFVQTCIDILRLHSADQRHRFQQLLQVMTTAS